MKIIKASGVVSEVRAANNRQPVRRGGADWLYPGWLNELFLRQRLLTHFGFLMLALAIPTSIALALDERLIREVSVWAKPLKFMVSTALFSITTAWFYGWLPPAERVGKLCQSLAWTIVLTSAFEVGYISLQAARGEGSHHNTAHPFNALMFGLMAVAAVLLTATQALLALQIFRYAGKAGSDTAPTRLAAISVGTWSVIAGLTLTFLLSTASGFMLGANQPPPGFGMPITGWHWNTSDMRPAHFLGVHAQQLIPLTGWLLLRCRASLAVFLLALVVALYSIAWLGAVHIALSA